MHYLVKVKRLRPEQIAVFAQHDAFGDAGFDGVVKAVRALQGDEGAIVRLGTNAILWTLTTRSRGSAR